MTEADPTPDRDFVVKTGAMTFLEAALEVLKREGKPLHYKELTERAMGKKLLTFVGRTPEVTMQTQLTGAVKKAPGSPFVRVKPGVFGLLRYPEMPPEVEAEPKARAPKEEAAVDSKARGEDGRLRRRRRRGGRGRTRSEGAAGFAPNGSHKSDEADDDAAGAAGAEGAEASDRDASDREAGDNDPADEHEPHASKLSAEARAAALAETGVLEGDDAGQEDQDDQEGDGEGDGEGEEEDEGEDGDEGEEGDEDADDLDEAEPGPVTSAPAGAAGAEASDEAGNDDLGDDDDEGGPLEAEAGGAPAGRPGEAGEAGEERGGRRRRRRRRRRYGEEGGAPGAQPASASPGGGMEGGAVGEAGTAGAGAALNEGEESARGESGPEGRSSGAPSGEDARERTAADAGAESSDGGQGSRRIMTPVDAAIEILRGQAPGRGVHVRQIADAAARRRLVHGEPNEAWRVMRTALAAEPRERLRAGQRPRVRPAGSGLFALARRPPDGELERAEQVFGEARRALRERTVAALERRIAELPGPAFEALARVLLQREGFGPATFVKRVEGTIYVEALRGRGSRPSRSLVGLRPGSTSAGRRAIGELRAGIRARNQDEGVLLLAGRLAEDAIAEWKQAGPPVEIADGQAIAETCIRHGVGVINAMVSVDFVDADFFAELAEG